jgi:ATP-binding cassette subfamily B protein
MDTKGRMAGVEQAASVAARSAVAALVAVARRHGVHLGATQILRDYAPGDGPTPSALVVRIAADHGLSGRTARLSWRQLFRLGQALPVILRLADGRFLILDATREENGTPVAVLRDPLAADGAPLVVDALRLAQVWQGETIFLKRRLGLRDSERPFGFLWMTAQVLREARLFRDVAVSAVVLSVLALAPAMLYMVVIDRVLVHQRAATLTLLVIGFAFVLLFDTTFAFVRRYLIAIATARIDARISTYIFDRLTGLSIDFFERMSTGIIAYKVSEIRRVRHFLTGQLFTTLLDATTLLVLVPTMFLLNGTLAFFVLTVVAVMCLTVALYLAPVSRAYGRVIEAEQRKNAFLIETIHGIRTVKSLALEGRKRREWDGRVAEAVRASTALQHLANQPQTILGPLEKLIYAGSLGIGAWLAMRDGTALQAGTLVAFTMIATRATQPFVQIASLLQQIQEVRGAMNQIASVVNLPPERQREGGARPAIQGAITFSGVRFRYPGAVTPALDGVSFTVDAGSVVGIMGRSGCGKTTVTRLLQGLHDGYEGLIKIDGIDLREIDLGHLRAHLGVVLQDNFLFAGTIRENILAGRADARPEDVMAAARLAGAEEFIERLPRGYDTVIEEGSANLSGGQRQRLAIARALLADPPVLIFDEATSALDPESEAIVTENLRLIARGRTVIVISHRLASLVGCDQILVLDAGRLQDCGRHHELLQRCEVYRHLWQQQNRHLSAGVSHGNATIAAARCG